MYFCHCDPWNHHPYIYFLTSSVAFFALVFFLPRLTFPPSTLFIFAAPLFFFLHFLFSVCVCFSYFSMFDAFSSSLILMPFDWHPDVSSASWQSAVDTHTPTTTFTRKLLEWIRDECAVCVFSILRARWTMPDDNYIGLGYVDFECEKLDKRQ